MEDLFLSFTASNLWKNSPAILQQPVSGLKLSSNPNLPVGQIPEMGAQQRHGRIEVIFGLLLLILKTLARFSPTKDFSLTEFTVYVYIYTLYLSVSVSLFSLSLSLSFSPLMKIIH